MQPKGFEIDLNNVFTPDGVQKLPDTHAEKPAATTPNTEAKIIQLRTRVAEAQMPAVNFMTPKSEPTNTNLEVPAPRNESPRETAAATNFEMAKKYLTHIEGLAKQRVNGATPEQQQEIAAAQASVEGWKSELASAQAENESQALDKSFDGVLQQYGNKSLEEFQSVIQNPGIRTILKIPAYVSNDSFMAAAARAVAKHPGNMQIAA